MSPTQSLQWCLATRSGVPFMDSIQQFEGFAGQLTLEVQTVEHHLRRAAKPTTCRSGLL
jgi:hypothetical protein